MFTGIIRHFGEVSELTYQGPMARLQVESCLDVLDVDIGDNISVNGVSLTIVGLERNKLSTICFDLAPETLDSTALGSLRTTELVHLEKALLLSDRINGHLVQGHIDGIGIILQKEVQGDALMLKIAAPQNILQLCIPRGSIGVDGVSLIINKIHSGSFELSIPLTTFSTNFKRYETGRRVNLENDIIGKYVYEILRKPHQADSAISWELMKAGPAGKESEFGTHL